MIFIGDIPNSMLVTHWEYFCNSEGFRKIKEYKEDRSLTIKERLIFRELFYDKELLKKIIVGKPHELRELVDNYNDNIILTGLLFPEVVFSFYTDFFVKGGWDSIWRKINRDESSRVNSKKITARKFYLSRRCTALEQHFKIINHFDSNINGLKMRYKLIENKINNSIVKWHNLLNSIFSYTKFTQKNDDWNAYKYTQELGVTVCPYCNRNYVHTIISNSGSTRPELDHFYPKSIYPFLSVSIYNLIPSCHVCNSNLKGSKNFFKDHHLHPYDNINQDEIKFKINYNDSEIKNIIPTVDQFDIGFELNEELNDLQKKMISNSIKTFKTNELYNNHKDIVQEIIFNSIYYNDSKKEELKLILGEESGIDESFIDRIIYGNYIQQKDFGKRPLAKFTNDIISSLNKN